MRVQKACLDLLRIGLECTTSATTFVTPGENYKHRTIKYSENVVLGHVAWKI